MPTLRSMGVKPQIPGWLTTSEYAFVYSRAPRLCVDLIIRNRRGSVLLSWRKIQPYKNTWHLPGGRVFFRERVSAAIQRIAKSELGSRVKVCGFLGYMEFPQETQGGSKIHTVSLAFAAELQNETLQGSFQADRFAYFSKIPKNACRIHANFLRSLVKK